jgi:hypothetical protein
MKKVLIIESEAVAIPENFSLIEKFPLANFNLICILGKDCSIWESIVDESLVGSDGAKEITTITTSHPNEKVSAVEFFARVFFKTENVNIEHQKI